jgi:hypothetical protein
VLTRAFALTAVCLLVGVHAFAQQPARVRVVQGPAVIWLPGFAAPATVVPAGTELQVISRRDTWYEVLLPTRPTSDRQVGYIAASQVELIGTTPVAERPLPKPQTSAPPAGSGGFVVRRAGERGFIAFLGGQRTSRTTLEASGSFAGNLETNTFSTSYPIESHPDFTVSAGSRMTAHLALALNVSRFATKSKAAVAAEFPHPFFFGQNRQAVGEATGFTREEVTLDINVLWLASIGRRLQVGLAGGPTVFHVTQDFVKKVNVTESYPYDEVTFVGVDTQRIAQTHGGGNIGAEATFALSPTTGITGRVRYSRANLPFAIAEGVTQSVAAGGTDVGVGVRFRF